MAYCWFNLSLSVFEVGSTTVNQNAKFWITELNQKKPSLTLQFTFQKICKIISALQKFPCYVKTDNMPPPWPAMYKLGMHQISCQKAWKESLKHRHRNKTLLFDKRSVCIHVHNWMNVSCQHQEAVHWLDFTWGSWRVHRLVLRSWKIVTGHGLKWNWHLKQKLCE